MGSPWTWSLLTPLLLLAAVSSPLETNSVLEDDPAAALGGMYSDCVLRMSVSCAQRKVLVFLDRLGRVDRFDLLGGLLTVVRTAPDHSRPITEEGLRARLGASGDALEPLIDHTVDRFFSSHALRVRLPPWLEAAVGGGGGGRAVGSTIDLSIGRSLEEEGRGKKKKKKKKLKLLKKVLLVLGLVKIIKLALLAPLFLILIKLKAVKALLIGKVALILAKVLLFKKLFMSLSKGGMGGGGGGCSGGCGGGDDEKHVIVVHADGHGGGGGGGGGGVDTSYGPPSSGGGVDTSYGPPSSGGGGGGGGGGGSWSSGGGGSGGGWGRSLGVAGDPHWLAYRAYAPAS